MGPAPYVKGWKSVVSADNVDSAQSWGRLMRHDPKSWHHDTKTRPRRAPRRVSLACLSRGSSGPSIRWAAPTPRALPDLAAQGGIRVLQHSPVWRPDGMFPFHHVLNLSFGPAARQV